jgi:hypothetical protein
MGDRLREAEKLCKEATKLTTPSLLSFRLKGEWEQATPLWERAAMLFRVSEGSGAAGLQHRGRPPAAACWGCRRPSGLPPPLCYLSAYPLTTLCAPSLHVQQCGDLGRAKECHERAGTGHERQRSGWHAAKQLEKAGELAGQLGQWEEVESHYRRAAELFAEEGRPTAAAEAAARGARALEEQRPAVGGCWRWVGCSGGNSMRVAWELYCCRCHFPS